MSFSQARAFLKQKGLEDRILTFPDCSTATVALAAEALQCETGRIAKTMSFMTADGPILVLMEGDARIDNRKYKDTFHEKARMITPDAVESAVGHAPGGVCPFGVKENVRIYLDDSLKRFDPVYPAAGDDHSAVRLALSELMEATDALGWVDIGKFTEEH